MRVIRTLGGVQYDSPEAEPSEDASSAIGPVLDSTFPSTVDLTAGTGTGRRADAGAGMEVESMEETSSTMDSAAIGAVMDTPEPSGTLDSSMSDTSEVTESVPNGSRRATGMREVLTANEIVAEGSDESEDGDDEEEEYDDDEEEEEEGDGDDEEEEEPVLKYSKIEQAAADILEKDAASAIAVGATYFVRLSIKQNPHFPIH